MQTVASTWDVAVVSAMNAASVISYIPRWQSIEFSDQLSDYGSGRLVHDFADPFFAQFESDNGFPLLTGPYALKIFRNGSAVFTFLIEDVQVARLPDAQTVTLSGRGIGAALEWAIVLPEGYSGQARVGAVDSSIPKLWDRDFLGYKWIARCATTTVLPNTPTYANGPMATYPGSGATLTANANVGINVTGIDGINDLIVGDTVLVKNQVTAAENGLYCVIDVGGTTAWRLKRIGDADGIVNLVAGNQTFVTEGATNGYKIWNLSSIGGMTLNTDVGTSSLTFTQVTTGGINALSAFWALFKEAQTGYEYATAPTEFGNQRTNAGRGGPNYAVDWPLYLDGVVDANKGYLDSKGQVIQDAGRFTVPQGKHMGEVLKQVTDQTGLAWHFDASGSVSFAVAPFSRQGVVNSVPFGTDRTSGSVAMLFTLPSMQTGETKSSVSDRRTVTYGSDQRGIDKVLSASATINTYGIRESWFENSSQDAPAIINFTTNAMRKIDGAKLSQTASFPERTGQTAWVDFSVGDKVLVETGIGTFNSLIIGAISASITPTNDQTIEVTFGDVFPDIASDLTTQGGFGSHNASIIAGFTGQTPNVNLPAPVTASVSTGVVGMSNRVTVTWDNTGSKAAQYEVAVFREGTLVSGVGLTRAGSLAVASKTSINSFLSYGMFVNVYPDTTLSANAMFACFNVPLLQSTTNALYFANQGPDVTASVSASVAQVLEYNTVIVDGSQSSATIENLSSPGSTYSYIVTPINELGLKSTKTIKSSFTSSVENFTLVGSAVQSYGFISGSTGWRITSAGNAEFNSITLPSSSAALAIGTDPNAFHVDGTGNMWLGAATYAAAPFKVSNAGSMTATTGTFSGAISGSTIDIGGSDTTSFHVDTSGNMWVGGATYAAAPFKISSAGFVTSANGATFTGSLNSSSDARFDGGGGSYAYIQNDGRFQSITSSTVYAQMGQSGIFVQDGTPFGSFNTTGQTTLQGIGIKYVNASFGPGTDNAMALQWNGSNPMIIVDNVYGIYVSGTSISDRRVKVNIAEPSNDWVDKLLNQVKIWQFDKINPLNDFDMHVYKGQIGVMADEFKHIFPQFESSSLLLDPDGVDADKIRSVDYTFMIPALVLIAQKFDARIKELEATLGI